MADTVGRGAGLTTWTYCPRPALSKGDGQEKGDHTMLKRFAVLGLAGFLTLAAASSGFAQSRWNGYFCEPPRYDTAGVPYGPYCPY